MKVRKIDEYIDEKNNQSKYFSNIGMNTEYAFDLIDYFDNYKDLYPNYSEDSEYNDDYFYNSVEEAYEQVNDILEFFDSLPNPIPIYRTIKVKSIDNIDYNDLGESWSYEKESAINFAKNNNNGNYLISGKTYFNNIDWKNTIKLYFLFSADVIDDSSEDEINIINSDDVFDIEVELLK